MGNDGLSLLKVYLIFNNSLTDDLQSISNEFAFAISNSDNGMIKSSKGTGAIDYYTIYGALTTVYNVDKDMLVNYGSTFDYSTSNPGSYVSTQDLSTGGIIYF